MPNFISEDQIEKAAVALLKDRYGYRTLNCFTRNMEDPADRSNRASKEEVVLYDVLRAAAVKINSAIPETVVAEALEKLTARRYAMSPLLANKEVYGLIRDGIPVQYEDAKGRTEQGRVRIIDFTQPVENDFCAVTQLWIKGDHYPRRPDILVYVNGLPLVFVELKNSNVQVRNAYDDNLTNYKKDIPLLFQYNASASSPMPWKPGSAASLPGMSSSSTGCAPTTRRKRSTARRSSGKEPAWSAC